MTHTTTFYPRGVGKANGVNGTEPASSEPFSVVLFTATPENDLWLGEAPLGDIARQGPYINDVTKTFGILDLLCLYRIHATSLPLVRNWLPPSFPHSTDVIYGMAPVRGVRGADGPQRRVRAQAGRVGAGDLPRRGGQAPLRAGGLCVQGDPRFGGFRFCSSYIICLSWPAGFTQPGARLFAEPYTLPINYVIGRALLELGTERRTLRTNLIPFQLHMK